MQPSRRTKLLLFCGAVLFLGALPLVALHISQVQEKIVQTLLREMEERLGHTVRIASFQWKPFSKLTLHDLEVLDGSGVLFQAPGVEVAYGIAFFSRKVGIDEIRLESPVLHVRSNALKGLNMPRSGRGEPAPEADSEPTPAPGSSTESNRSASDILSWKGSELIISSGTLIGYADSGKMLFQTRMSGTFNLERIMEKGVGGVAPDFDALPGRDWGSMSFGVPPPAGQGI